jgi:hypothetical protein
VFFADNFLLGLNNLVLGEPPPLAAFGCASPSGYPLHHLHAFISFMRFGGSAAIPLAAALLSGSKIR